MFKIIFIVIGFIYFGIQLIFLDLISEYVWIFIIGDVIIGITLFIIQWIEEFEEEGKEDERKEN
jgi:hypothetical protein